MLVLSPRAAERLESYTPPWPMPKLFRMTKGGKIEEGIFRGETINTPSMLCVEDALDALIWAEKIGGHKELMRRSQANPKIVADWVEGAGWAEVVARDPATSACTSIGQTQGRETACKTGEHPGGAGTFTK